MKFDQMNGNNNWREAQLLELQQIHNYNTFKDKGRRWIPGSDYHKIGYMFVYAVKHDGRHKARLVTLGNMTPEPVHSVYSSVASLRGVRLTMFLAELNKMKLWGPDIGNAYLESYTDKQVYVIAGPEFGELEGHALVITKALYGLRKSRKNVR